MAHLYLDNHTTTRPSPKAIEAAMPYWREKWGSASAPHSYELQLALKEGYANVRKLLGARESDTIRFTSSGAEAVGHVIMSAYLDQAREKGKTHFLTTAIDEAPIILSYERLQELGCETDLIPVTEKGCVTIDAVAEAITPRTALISLSWANAMTGVIQPVEEIAKLCQERGILLHLEASHILGKIPFDLDEIAPDFISFNGDHIHAPAGTGALFIRSGLKLNPLILGESEAPVAPLISLGIACLEALEHQSHIATETARLRHYLEENLDGNVLFQKSKRLPTTTCIDFPGVTSDALLYRMQRKNIYASFGGGMFQQLTLQLEACGIHTHSAISLSLSRETTQKELDLAITEINTIVRSLRELSKELL